MSLNQEEREAVVTYRLEKAAKTMEQAKCNLPMHFWELVANRMYYAAYYAVSALLIANGHTAKIPIPIGIPPITDTIVWVIPSL